VKSENFVLNFLSEDSFTLVNKRLLRFLKGDAYAALMLGELISQYRYFRKRGEAKDGWFFQTVDYLYEEMSINDYFQRKAIGTLETLGLVQTKKAGNPPKRHFLICMDNLEKIFIGEEVKPKSKIINPKKEFYSKLNKAIYQGVDEFGKAIDNIPRDIAEFMFAWAHYYKYFASARWEWNSKEFGKINNYWSKVYRNKRHFNFASLVKYFQSIPVEPNLYDFINADRGIFNTEMITFAQLYVENSICFIFDKKEVVNG
jgi:hypothetical protein